MVNLNNSCGRLSFPELKLSLVFCCKEERIWILFSIRLLHSNEQKNQFVSLRYCKIQKA